MGDSNISSPGLQPSSQLSNLGSTETLEEMPSGSQDKVRTTKALAKYYRVVFCKGVNTVLYDLSFICQGAYQQHANIHFYHLSVFPSGFCRSPHSRCRTFALTTLLPLLHWATRVTLIRPKWDYGVPLLKTFQWCPLSLNQSCQWSPRPDLLWPPTPASSSLSALLT